MTYALATIWYERQRFLPAILAVAFSAILIAVQCGLMIGMLSLMSLPVDKATSDVWVGYPGLRSVDLGRPVPERWAVRVAAQPGVERVEPAVIGFSLWTAATSRESPATPEVITVVGSKLEPNSLGATEYLRDHPDLMVKLSEPYTVAVDESAMAQLSVHGVGEYADVFGHRVRVVGFVQGYQSLGGPYVFCNIATARQLLREPPGSVTYHLARCKSPEDAQRVVASINHTYPQLSAFTADELSMRSRLYWLTSTKAGVGVGFTAILGLLVGAVVTSQTLYAATAASQREFATLRAMGIPSWRLQFTVMEQSLWVGLFGIAIALPITIAMSEVAGRLGTEVRLHPLVLGSAALITLVMALVSGLAALRSFRRVDPADNIR